MANRKGASQAVRFFERNFFKAAQNRAYQAAVNAAPPAAPVVADVLVNGKPLEQYRERYLRSALAEWDASLDADQLEPARFESTHRSPKGDWKCTPRPSSRGEKLNRHARVKPLHKEVTLGFHI